MPLLLLLPLLALCLAALVIALLPLSLWQRYRRGHARRRAVGWAVGVNAWASLVALTLFAASAAASALWIDGALVHAVGGVAAGAVLGAIGLWLTRFEHDGAQLHYTPNRLLVAALTLLVAARIAVALWRSAHLGDAAPAPWWLQPATLFSTGGALLGYASAYAWGVRRRLRGGAA